MNAIKNYAMSVMSERRWQHTLGVAETAGLLSEYFMPDRREELVMAAILHDVAKEMPYSDQRALIKSQGITLTEEDLGTLPALHSFAGAALVLRDFPDIASEDIVSAISNHTLGDPNMTLFDKIIYISDYIEPGRRRESCKKVRNLLLSAIKPGEYDLNLSVLNRAIISAIDNTYEYLSSQGIKVNSKMLETKKELIGLI